MIEPGDTIAARFEVERRVSAGGMSAVFRATDLRLGGVVAIKVLYGRDAGEHKERLYREARILEKLSHPGIVKHVSATARRRTGCRSSPWSGSSARRSASASRASA